MSNKTELICQIAGCGEKFYYIKHLSESPYCTKCGKTSCGKCTLYFFPDNEPYCSNCIPFKNETSKVDEKR